MATVLAPLAHEETSTTGLGSYTTNQTPKTPDHATFDQRLATGNEVAYMVRGDGNNWEINIGVFTAPNILARGVILSTNGDLPVNWGSGVKDIYSVPDIELLGTASFLQAANNLSDVNDPGTALDNIGGLEAAANLSDLLNVATARNNLGLGSAALLDNTDVYRKDIAINTHTGAVNVGLELLSTGGNNVTYIDLGESPGSPRVRLQWHTNFHKFLVDLHNGTTNERVLDIAQDDILLGAGVVLRPQSEVNVNANANSRLVVPVGVNKWAVT